MRHSPPGSRTRRACARPNGGGVTRRRASQSSISKGTHHRSLLLRDPDGNLINLFTPISEADRRRFAKDVGAER